MILPTTAAEGNVDHPSADIVTSSTPTTGASMLYYGFKYGFPLHFKGACSSFLANNLLSAQQNPGIVSAKFFGVPGLSTTLLLLNFVFLPWELFLRKLWGSIS